MPIVPLKRAVTAPIPRACDADRAANESLVQRILDLKAADRAADVSELEAEIDAIVERLYFGESAAGYIGTQPE